MANYNLNKFCMKTSNKLKNLHILDQGVSPISAMRSLEILPDNSKIIIVHRDQEDVYLAPKVSILIIRKIFKFMSQKYPSL